MITGDYPMTALAVARAAGIDASAGVLTGAEISCLTPESLREQVRTVRVFARIMPEQKLALVEAMKANGEVGARACRRARRGRSLSRCSWRRTCRSPSP